MNENIYKELLKQNTKNVYNKKKSLRKLHDRSALKTLVKEKKLLKKFVVL